MSAPQYEIRSINDLLQFDDEQFARMLPDLVLWHRMMRDIMELGAEPEAMAWIDDGKPGQLHSMDLILKRSGEVRRITGPAYEEDRND